jgi:hypothetical protein
MKLFKRSLLGLLTITAVAIVFYSCDKISIPVNVPLTASGISFTIPVAPTGDTSVDFTYAVNIDSLITTNSSLDISNIKSVKIDTVTINATNATSGNSLYNINTAEVTLASDAVATAPVQIAALSSQTDGFPNIESSLVIPVNSAVNVSGYVAAGNVRTTFTFHLHCNVQRAISPAITANATVHFIVQASL